MFYRNGVSDSSFPSANSWGWLETPGTGKQFPLQAGKGGKLGTQSSFHLLPGLWVAQPQGKSPTTAPGLQLPWKRDAGSLEWHRQGWMDDGSIPKMRSWRMTSKDP